MRYGSYVTNRKKLFKILEIVTKLSRLKGSNETTSTSIVMSDKRRALKYPMRFMNIKKVRNISGILTNKEWSCLLLKVQ